MVFTYKIFLSLLISLIFSMHPIHVSVTNINIDNKNEIIKISCKVFTDDFQTIINNNYKSELNINDSLNVNKNIYNIVSYFNKNLEIKLNNNKSIENLTFIDFKSNFEATWFNFKIALSDKNINKIEIKNLILTDLYKNQNNLVIIKNNNTEKGYHLNVTDNIIKLSLK